MIYQIWMKTWHSNATQQAQALHTIYCVSVCVRCVRLFIYLFGNTYYELVAIAVEPCGCVFARRSYFNLSIMVFNT